MRLIDADALIKWVQECGAKWPTVSIEKVFQTIKDASTIDPVKHGKWIPVNERTAKCSLCGGWESTNGIDKTGTAIIHRALKHYCPNCGARMDGEE